MARIGRIAKTITQPRLGCDVLRLSRIALDLPAKKPDVSPQIFELVSILGTPDCAQQFRVIERYLAVPHQVLQKVELYGRQMDFLARFAKNAMGEIQLKL